MVKPPRKAPQARKVDDTAEAIASFAPPPSWIEPCIPTLVAKPPKGDRWRHEVKWDGYRVCVVIDAGKAKVRTRRGHDWSDKFRPIASAAASLPCHNAIIDGEAVVLDAKGRASFSALQADLAGGGKGALVYAFDCLFLDGRDLRKLPLSERREMLDALLFGRPKSSAILLSEEFEGDGAEFFKTACAHELEGIVSKRVDLPYHSGRSQDWLKVKCVQSDAFVIIGYQPDGRGGIANLKLAVEENGALRYAGAVGTGFSNATMRMLRKVLDPLAEPRSAAAWPKVKGAIWVRPELHAEIAYRGFTTAGELRHASFKGLRGDE
jgi:bifunctional non-homologous end joining protein LigD